MCNFTHQPPNRIDLQGEAVERAYASVPWLAPDVVPRTWGRVVEALRDPDLATPRLARAARMWRGQLFLMRNSDGQPIVEEHEKLAKVLLTLHAAADEDDRDERERQRMATAMPSKNGSVPPDALVPVAEQLRELVAVTARQADSLARQADSVGRLADQLAPKQETIVGCRHVADKLGLKSTQAVAEMARTRKIALSCVVPGTGNGTPWQFYRDKIDAWINAGRPSAKGKGKRG
jgi:hypothetical protein